MSQKQSVEVGSSHAQTATAASPIVPRDPAVTHLKEGLVDGTHDVAGELKHVAGEVAGEAKKAAESKLGASKEFAAAHLGSVAAALRQTSYQLRLQESGMSEYVDKAASSVDNVSDYLETRTLGQLIGDVESYARREPAVFLGGAFVVGVLGGRFLKSATPRARRSGAREESRQETTGRSIHNGEHAQPRRSEGVRPVSSMGAALDRASDVLTSRTVDKGSDVHRSTPSDERITRPHGSSWQYGQVQQDKPAPRVWDKPSEAGNLASKTSSGPAANGGSPTAAPAASGSVTPSPSQSQKG
jgi:hypothetical protein